MGRSGGALRRARIASAGAALALLGALLGAGTPVLAANRTAIPAGYGEGPGFCASVVSNGQDLGGGSTSLDNIYPCGPEPGSSFPSYGDLFQPAGGFQCTELANRFLYDVWGYGPVFGSSLDGANYSQTVHNDYPQVPLIANGTAGQPYLPGDIVSFTGNSNEPDGHVAVVIASTENASGDGSVTIMEQNAASSGQETLTVSNWALQPAPGAWVSPYDFLALASGTSFAGYESAFQANTGNLYVFGDILNANLQQGMAPGTSPAIAVLPSGGYETAFQANTGDLFIYGDDGSADLRLGMMPGTSPAIAASPNGGFQVAFQANTGDLYTYTSGVGATNWQLGMAPGTSPAIAALPGGGYEEAFQANTHNLWVVGDGGSVGDTKLGMMPGTSPSIATSPRGGFRAAFQANTSSLYTYTSGSGAANWQLGMDTASSPAVAALAGGGYEEAFQANTHNLWIVGDGGTVGDTKLGMMPQTSPAIAASPAGGFRAAFQANTGSLYNYSSGTGPVDLQQGMLGRTSPCIASVSGGGCAPGSSDVTPPTVSMGPVPTATLRSSVALSWSAADGGADLASYDVRWRRAGFGTKFGSWRYRSGWQGTTSTSGQLSTSPGSDYCVQARARDWAGNVSGWSGQQCVARALDDRALAAGPGWSRRTGSGYYLRTYTVTRRARRVLTLAPAELDRVGLVATECPSCGRVAVYVGSARIGIISLSAATTAKAQVIMLPPFAYRRGTVTIKTLSAGRTVQIDGLVISRT